MSRQGYLPSRIFGYAFALFAFVRGELDPPWAKHLRLDAASALKKGLRYLQKTGDSLFHLQTIQRREPLARGEVIARLQNGSPSFRLATLWHVRERKLAERDVVMTVMDCLEDRDEAIPGEAARTLGEVGGLADLGPGAPAAISRLTRALSSTNEATRAGAAGALGKLARLAEAAIPDLSVLLEDRSRAVVSAAAGALRAFGPAAGPALKRLLPALRKALLECNHSLVEELTATLAAVTNDPERRLRTAFADHDGDLRMQALEALRRQTQKTS
jgi:HEAT repeat protein